MLLLTTGLSACNKVNNVNKEAQLADAFCIDGSGTPEMCNCLAKEAMDILSDDTIDASLEIGKVAKDDKEKATELMPEMIGNNPDTGNDGQEQKSWPIFNH